jgi:hypothetical protein
VKEPRAACLPAAAMPEGRHHVYGTPGPWPPPQRDIPGEETSTIGVRFEMMPNGEVHVSEVSPLSTAPVREHTVPPFAQRLCLCGNDFVLTLWRSCQLLPGTPASNALQRPQVGMPRLCASAPLARSVLRGPQSHAEDASVGVGQATSCFGSTANCYRRSSTRAS